RISPALRMAQGVRCSKRSTGPFRLLAQTASHPPPQTGSARLTLPEGRAGSRGTGKTPAGLARRVAWANLPFSTLARSARTYMMTERSAGLAGPSSQFYFSQRLRLHYVDWGNEGAPPLLMIHGGRDHCRNWDWTAQAMRERYHVIAPDLR